MSSKRFSQYFKKKERLVEKLRKDCALAEKDFPEEANKIEEQLQKIYREIYRATVVRDNVKKGENLSTIQRRLLIANGIDRYGNGAKKENLALDYISQQESSDSVIKKLLETQDLYNECGVENKKGFGEYISGPWARLFERKMTKEEYASLNNENFTPLNWLGKILTYKK